MSLPIFLMSDLGEGSIYVAAMRAVALTLSPKSAVYDITHSIPPHDIAYAALVLEDVVPYLPPCVLVVVVDPGVGGERAVITAKSGEVVAIAPDNGVLTPLLTDATVFRVENESLMLCPISPTFHGRDIMAPVAARIAAGLNIEEVGPKHKPTMLVLPEPDVSDNLVKGRVVHVDTFGNLVTNIKKVHLEEAGIGAEVSVRVSGRQIGRRVRTYSDARKGTLVWLWGSFGRLEVAVVEGSAAERLKATRGSTVEVCGS